LKLEKDTEKAAVEGRTARAGRFTRSLDWLEVALLAAMAPIFVFPKRERVWLFLVFPLIWTLRWATGREEIGGRGARTAIDAAMLIICIQLLISTLVSGDMLSGLPKIAGVLVRDSCLLCPGEAAEIKGTDPDGNRCISRRRIGNHGHRGDGDVLGKGAFFREGRDGSVQEGAAEELGFPGGRAWTESECRGRRDDAFRALMRCAGGVRDDEKERRESPGFTPCRCCAPLKAGLEPCLPQGSYCVLSDVTHLLGNTSKEKAMFILPKSGVAGVPDEAFFHEPGESQFIRFCFAKEDKELDEACRRLERLKLTEAIKLQGEMQKGDIAR
jgi:hypothetical protein